MTLKLSPAHLEEIRRHGRETYPHECCGFMLGKARGEEKEVVRLLPAANTREDSPQNRYLIPPEAYLGAEQEAERAGLDIVGFYHSHPDHEARPSEFDRSHALPWCSYVIVSVREGAAGDTTSWVLSEDYSRFESEPLVELSLEKNDQP